MANGYQYDNKPRNIFRFGLAVLRVMRDPENTEEAAIVELTFNRSRWGKKVSRWDLVAQELVADYPQLAPVVAARERLAKVDLDALIALPTNTLGHTLAKLELARGIDPNLVDPLPHDSDGEWVMAHMYETHDFWHVLTGFGFDMEGEFGVAGVYMGQLRNVTFFAFMLSILLMKNVWKDRDQLGIRMRAFSEGYQIGQRSQPLIGLDWSQLWHRDMEELRRELNISEAGRIDTTALAA
jgi:ubiquinone biosynthesis protein COQ4